MSVDRPGLCRQFGEFQNMDARRTQCLDDRFALPDPSCPTYPYSVYRVYRCHVTTCLGLLSSP